MLAYYLFIGRTREMEATHHRVDSGDCKDDIQTVELSKYINCVHATLSKLVAEIAVLLFCQKFCGTLHDVDHPGVAAGREEDQALVLHLAEVTKH